MNEDEELKRRLSLTTVLSSVSEICTTRLPSSIKTRLSRAVSVDTQSIPNDSINDTESIASDDLVFDVLPSFQMYNTLHKNIPTGDIMNPSIDSPPDYSENTNVQRSLQEEESEPLDVENVYYLPKVKSPIEIEIHVTKTTCKPNEQSEDEAILREFTTGDYIQGYLCVENKSDDIIPFEMFYVTLEGYICVIDRIKERKTIKRFLRAVDFSASWSDGSIVTASGINYLEYEYDNENYLLGLRNDRLLMPGGKYKKFFSFRVPGQILDNTCPHQTHVSLPPSFGIDGDKGMGKYLSIQVDPLVGYGHMSFRGTPVLTDDFSGKEISVNYTVDARMVGKDHDKKLCLLKEAEYNFRLVPFGYSNVLETTQRQIDLLGSRVNSRLSSLRHFLDKFEKGGSLSIRDTSLSVPKLIPPGSVPSAVQQRKKLCEDDAFVAVHSSYSIVQKKKKLFGSSIVHNNKTGTIKVSSRIPEQSLKYHSPNLIRKANSLGNITDKKNAINLKHHQNDSMPLKSIDIHFECIPTQGSTPHDPPAIKNVSMQLMILTYRTPKPLPVSMDPLYMASADIEKLNGMFHLHQENVQSLKGRFDENAINRVVSDGNIKFHDFIDPQLESDIKSLSQVKIAKSFAHKAFPNVTDFGSPWVHDGINWTKLLRLDVEFSKSLASTIIPSFQSCQIGRGYLIRITIHFEGVQDSTVLDLPVSVGRY